MPYSQADYAKPVTFPRDEQEEQELDDAVLGFAGFLTEIRSKYGQFKNGIRLLDTEQTTSVGAGAGEGN